MNNLIKFIIIFITIIILDILWFSISINMYKNQIKIIQNEEMILNIYAGFIAYILLAFSVLFIANMKNYESKKDLIINCGIFGLLAYGIFNFTNMAIFKNYNIKTALADTTWGCLVLSLAGYIYTFL